MQVQVLLSIIYHVTFASIFVGSDVAVFNDEPSQDFGCVHIVLLAAETHNFRVASSPLDAELLYVTGGRSWSDSSGTSVLVWIIQ